MSENDTLTSALLDQVTANLPSMVGTQLRKRLEQADKDAVIAATASAEVTRLTVENKLLANKLTLAIAAYESVGKRDETLATKERQLELKEAVLREREENMKVMQAYPLAVMDKIFRERSLLSNINLNGNLPGGGSLYLSGTSTQVEQK